MEPNASAFVKLCKLVAHADGTTGPESETALAMAVKFGAKHGFTLDRARAFLRGAVGRADAVTLYRHTPGSSANWRRLLGWAVAKYTNVYAVWSEGEKLFLLSGTPADLEAWRTFFLRAESEIDVAGTRHALVSGLGKSGADAFKKAAAVAFGERLRTFFDSPQAAAAAASTALALPSRMAAAREFREEKVKTKQAKPTKIGDAGSAAAGAAFANRIGLHKAEVSGE